LSEKTPIILVLENIRSLHNVGAIFRSADAANIQEIILGGLTATPPRHEIEKTALGATKTVPWRQVADVPSFLKRLQADGYTITALEQTPTSTNVFSTQLAFPIALVVGHERTGVTPETLAVCSHHVELPMLGKSAHSLNVSNATTAALYELGRRVWYHTQ
jgi:23S rRNA (guanosine2251-2'-O)-methyltransferase